MSLLAYFPRPHWNVWLLSRFSVFKSSLTFNLEEIDHIIFEKMKYVFILPTAGKFTKLLQVDGKYKIFGCYAAYQLQFMCQASGIRHNVGPLMLVVLWSIQHQYAPVWPELVLLHGVTLRAVYQCQLLTTIKTLLTNIN